MDHKIQCPKCQHAFLPDDVGVGGDDAPFAVKTGEAPSEPRSIGRVRRYTARGVAFRIAMLAAAVAFVWGVRSTVRHIFDDANRQERAESIGGRSEPSHSAGVRSEKRGAKPRDVTEAPPSSGEMLANLEHSVVQLHSVGVAGDTSLGSGFVIDDSGLVATSYHVVANATRAYVEFRDGERCNILGYAAVEPERDLAIVRLETTPLKIVPIPMAGEENPKQLASVVALGHPNGLAYSPYDGKVSRVLKTSQLPVHSQRFLQQLLSGNLDATWIQHTARLSDGNSGGPLLDQQGRVIGVNTWVDRQTQFSYALHVKHLRDLQGRLSEDTQPLGAPAKRDEWVTRWLDSLDAERVRALFDELEGFHFLPSSPDDYRQLQKLAWSITVANSPSSLTLGPAREKQFEKLEKEADRVVAKLRRRKWNGPGQILLLNEFAAHEIGQPLSGVFTIGSLLRVVEGGDGSSGALIEISGTDITVFVPLVGRLFQAPPNAPLLLLGVNYNGRVVRYGDNPLQLKSAPVIVAGALIRLDD